MPQENRDFTILKTDSDKRLVFGWASIVITVDGRELEDRQHDMIDPEDLEEAAYDYVLNFRDTGEEHLPGYRKKGKLVESCVLTKEKQRAMGIPDGVLPVGWWIGFYIEDDDAWERVKNGTYRMFSIEGKAQREEVRKTDSPGVGVLVVRDGKILTGTRTDPETAGQICGPGGHIEPGETPEEAAIREAYEEFGIICQDLIPVGDAGNQFICVDFSGTPKADEDEMTDMKWRTSKELQQEKLFAPFEESLKYLPQRTAKSFNEIRKFNPFHDSMGRFSSSHGMKSFSANPKTKAGQMAIGRSDAAGYGHVNNVHRESKGENIGQNQKWITTGQKPATATAAPKTISKPKTTKPAEPDNANEQNKRQMVVGKDRVNDIVAEYQKTGHQASFDDLLTQQGFKDKPQVVDGPAFQQAVKESGIMGFRTVSSGTDVKTKQPKSSEEFADLTMNGESKDVSMNGSGMKLYGEGMYIATAAKPKAGQMPSNKKIADARADSEKYGWDPQESSVMSMTLSKSAKVVDATALDKEFSKQPTKVKEAFGFEPNSYAAAKGYDAIRNKDAGWGCDYTVVLNRSALIFNKDVRRHSDYIDPDAPF